mgnify:CR=1 FL=1
MIGTEPVDDATLLKIVRSHFNTHFVAREDAHSVDPHASGEMTEQLMVFGLWTQDLDVKGCIGKRFNHESDEFYDILSHKRK